METIIPSFMRVQRGLITTEKVTALIEHVARSGHEDLTPEDRLNLLDLPGADDVVTNISSVTSLSRPALTQRAAESPGLLTEAELYLLFDRYWTDITRSEKKAMLDASDVLILISSEHRDATTEQLRLLRKPLYDNAYEVQALEGAGVELKRRFDAQATLRYEKDLQDAMTSFKGPDWARRLLEEEKGTNPWGFAQYVDPLAAVHFDLEHYFARADALLMFAKTNVGYGKLLSGEFLLQHLDWPGTDPATRDRTVYVAQRMQSHEAQEFDEKDAARVYMASKQPDDIQALRTKFQLLREHLKSIRDRARLPQYGNGGRCRYDALVEGVLSNAFIVIDGTCISSLYTGPQYADNVWVWAVDPDYDDSNASDSTSSDSDSEIPQYRGFLRVRIQQLADKFFEARKYRNEVPMSELWSVAQKSRKTTFISLDEKEWQAHRSDRMTGSALGRSRPA